VLIDTACRSPFHHPPDRLNFRRTDFANSQTHLEGHIPFDSELHNGMALNTCVENFSDAVLQALVASTLKCRPRDDPRPPIPARNQDEIRLKNRLRRRWQVTRDLALKAEDNRLQRSVTRRPNEWRNDQWSATLESFHPEDHSLWRITKRVMRVPTPSPPLVTPVGIALSVSEKLETQFQPVTDPSVAVIIEMVDLGLRSYLMATASEPKLANPEEVQVAIRGLKFSKTPGRKGNPNRA